MIKRKEKLGTELAELKAKVDANMNPLQQLLHKVISTQNALNQVSKKVASLEKHQQLELQQIDIFAQSITPAGNEVSKLQEQLQQVKTELKSNIQQILPDLKEDREALHTIVQTELDINVMAKKKRDSAIQSVAMGAAMIAVVGIGLAAGISTGILPAALLISTTVILTYKIGNAIRNKMKAPKKSMAKIEATKGAERLLENATELE